MKKLIAVLLTAVPMYAMAGKLEREFQKSELTPAIAAAEAEYKKACGCGLKISVDPKLKSVEELTLAMHVAESIKDGAAGHCTDAESKKAVCQMSTLKIDLTKETKFSFAGSTGTADTDGSSFVSFEIMTNQLDK